MLLRNHIYCILWYSTGKKRQNKTKTKIWVAIKIVLKCLLTLQKNPPQIVDWNLFISKALSVLLLASPSPSPCFIWCWNDLECDIGTCFQLLVKLSYGLWEHKLCGTFFPGQVPFYLILEAFAEFQRLRTSDFLKGRARVSSHFLIKLLFF